MTKYELKLKLLEFRPLVSCYITFKRIILNGKFLLTENLYQDANAYDVSILKHELAHELSYTHNPIVKSVDETFEMLIHSNYSFCRFGDGEFENILQIPVPFSNTRLEALSKRLVEVLSSQHPSIRIGLPLRMYSGKANLSRCEILFWRRPFIRKLYALIDKYCSPTCIYYAAEVTLPFCFQNTNFEKFFTKSRQIWNGKDIIIIAGKRILSGLQYNIFDNANSVEFLDAPSKNAFAEYETILQKALATDKNRLKIIILGQTATVLAYDLALQGHRALDLGHIAKAYDWYKTRGKKFIAGKFYAAD